MARQYVDSDGGVINETGEYQYVSSDGGILNETSGDTTTSCTITWTEVDDTTSITSTVTVIPSGVVAWTETDDTSSVTVNVTVSSVSSALSWTEDSDTSSITGDVAIPSGTLTTAQFKNNTGSVLANLTGLTVTVLNLSTLAFVKTFTGQTTNASGVMTINDPLFETGVQYVVITKNVSDTLGAEKSTAS